MSRQIERLWMPPNRTASQLRNSRAKLIGSLLIVGAILVAVVLALT